jgi:hypothetical protein
MEKNCGCHETPLACVECGTPVLERVNYYDGQFLVARDLSDEQRFLLAQHREHVHRLHSAGTLCGLKVTQHPDPACIERFVVIEPGLAVDCCGREIHITEKVCVDLRAELSGADPPGPDDKTLLISLCYDECRTEYAPALYSDCSCGEERCEPARVRESFQVKLQMARSVPQPPPRDPAGVRIDRSGTLNYANAIRMAVDANLSRIYLLNGNTPSQIAVYDSDTGCLLGSIDAGAQALDLAVSPDGNILYLIVHLPGPPETNKLRALNVKDLSAVSQVGADLDAGDGAIDATKPPRVVCSSTRVFVLNAVARKVYIFDTSPALALYTTFDKTEDFRAMDVTADGTWLFVASPAHVWAAKVATLTGTPTVIVIAVADDPSDVAVSGDGQRLFVATIANTVHLFRVQETPVPFPEVGSGVSVTDAVVSMVASESGEWLYVLCNAAGKGLIRVVDADKLDASPANAVGNPVPAGDTPEEILLDAAGKELYVVLNGAAGAPCAGAALFQLTERDCEEILWKALDGCPECDDPTCVLLAAVTDFTLGAPVTDARIDNRVRPLAPSTQALREMIECCCSAHAGAGAKGPRGDPGTAATVAVGTTTTGAPGSNASATNVGTTSAAVLDFVIPQGAKGDSGASASVAVGTTTTGAAGTNASVTNSGTAIAAVLDFVIPQGAKGDSGASASIAVGTTTTGAPGTNASVTNSGTAGAAVFDFVVPQGPKGDPGAPCDCCEAELTRIIALSWVHDKVGTPFAKVGRDPAIIVQFGPGQIDVPDLTAAARIFRVEMQDQPGGLFRCFCEVIGQVIPVKNPQPSGGLITKADRFTTPPAKTEALAFIFPPQAKDLISNAGAEVRVTLLGDFLTANGRAIDAEFPRAELPTGDHPSGAKEGIQGGTFHSWLWIAQRPQPQV